MHIRKCEVARPPRFERGTLCLEGRCSIQLSYGRLRRSTPASSHSIHARASPFPPASIIRNRLPRWRTTPCLSARGSGNPIWNSEDPMGGQPAAWNTARHQAPVDIRRALRRHTSRHPRTVSSQQSGTGHPSAATLSANSCARELYAKPKVNPVIPTAARPIGGCESGSQLRKALAPQAVQQQCEVLGDEVELALRSLEYGMNSSGKREESPAPPRYSVHDDPTKRPRSVAGRGYRSRRCGT